MVPQIDFLPATYHVQRRRQTQTLWRRMMVFFFLALAMLGTWQQRTLRLKLDQRRGELQARAQGLQQTLPTDSQLEQQFKEWETKAQLLTTLELRVPATRMLAAVTEALPEFVSLSECQVEQVPVESKPTTNGRVVASTPQEAKPPLETDLQELRADADKVATGMTLAGLAPDDFAISRYLVRLRETDLFERVTLVFSGETRVREESLRNFQIRLQVRNPVVWLERRSAEDRRVASKAESRARTSATSAGGLTP